MGIQRYYILVYGNFGRFLEDSTGSHWNYGGFLLLTPHGGNQIDNCIDEGPHIVMDVIELYFVSCLCQTENGLFNFKNVFSLF